MNRINRIAPVPVFRDLNGAKRSFGISAALKSRNTGPFVFSSFRAFVINICGVGIISILLLMATLSAHAAPGVPILVFNSLSWTRTDTVEVESPFPGEDVRVQIVDEKGKTCAGQNLADTLRFTARDVPPVGCKLFWARRVSKEPANPIKIKGSVIENQFFRVRVDPGLGAVTEIYDKVNKRMITPPKGGSAALRVIPAGPSRKPKNLVGGTEVVVMERGPARGKISFDHEWGESSFVQELKLHDGVPRIDIRSTVELSDALKASFPTLFKNAKKTLGNQLGSTEWCGSKTGICGVRWIDVSEDGYGMSVLSDSRQSFDITGGVIQMTFVESKSVAISDSHERIHEFNYSLYPHKGGWRAAGVDRRSFEVTYPLSARVVREVAESEAKSRSYVSISGPNVIVRALRDVGPDGSLTIRLYELRGIDGKIEMKLNLPAAYFQETDQFEKPIGEKTPIEGSTLRVTMRKHQIRTFKLE